MDTVESPVAQRERVRVRGTVQGVGFRPFVWRLAHELDLDGWVLNDAEGVLAEVQGPAEMIDLFVRRLRSRTPPLARIGSIEREPRETELASGFAIVPSRQGPAATPVTADASTCPDCVRAEGA